MKFHRLTFFSLFILPYSLTLQGCFLPQMTKPLFSTQNEMLVFGLDGTLLRKSPALRGTPRAIAWLPDGKTILALDGAGLARFNPETGEVEEYIGGPPYLSALQIVAGRTVMGMQPTYLTVWYYDEALKFLDDKGRMIGSIPIPQGCLDADLLDNGNILLTEGRSNRLREIKTDGTTVWQSQVSLLNPYDSIPTPWNTILVSDFDHHRVIVINRNNQILYAQEGFNHPRRLALLSDRKIFAADSDQRRIVQMQQNGGVSIFAEKLNRPNCVAVDEARRLVAVGIESFFPPSPEDQAMSASDAKWNIWLIWWISSILLTALFLLYYVFRESLQTAKKQFAHWTEQFLERFGQRMLAAGVLLGILAAALWSVAYIWSGVAAMSFGAVLAILSRGQSKWRFPEEMLEEEAAGEEIEEEAPPSAIRFPFLLLIGLLANWFAVIWSYTWINDWFPVIFWFLGPLACVYAFRKRARSMFRPSDIVWLALIFLVAAFFRLYRLDDIPRGLWLDETYSVWDALTAMENGTLAPFQTMPLVRANEFEVPNLYLLLVAVTIKFFGASFYYVKSLSIIPGLGIVLAVYCLGRWSFGPWAGRLGALCIAMNSWMVTFSRWGWLQQLYVFLAIFALAYTLRAIRWKCPRSAALAGLFLGYGFYTYVPILLTTAALIAIYALVLLEPERKRYFKQALITALLCAVVFAPLWIYYYEHPGVFLTRAQGVGLTKDLVQAGSLKPLKENLWLYAKAFHRQGDFIPRHNLPYNPLLDPITGGLAGIGMLLLLWRFYGFGERALLIAFALGMIGGVFSARLEAPNTFRIGMAGPIVCLIAALPLASLCAVRDRKKDERSPQRWTLIFVAVLGIIAMEFNYERYFKEFPCQETWIGSMGQVQDLIYRQITPQDLGPERLFVYHGFATRTFKLYMYFLDVEKNGKDAKFSTTLYTIMDLKTYIPPLALGENIFVTPPDYEDLMKEKIPGIEVEILKNPYGVAEAALGRIGKK